MLHFSDWNYYLNMAGTEFPINNLDEFFSDTNRKNMLFSIGSEDCPERKEERWTYKYDEWSGNKSKELLPPTPFNLTIFKGSRGVLISRDYTDFILNHPVPRALRHWMKETLVPDESYFPTLARISNISHDNVGSSLLWKVSQNFNKSFDTTYEMCLRYTKWAWDGKCHGKISHYNCVFAMEDYCELLQDPKNKTCLIANKFNLDVDPRPVFYLARNLSPMILNSDF